MTESTGTIPSAITRFWPFFRDDEAQRHLEEKGYVVLRDFADPATLHALTAIFDRYDPHLDRSFYVSNFCGDEATNDAIDQEVRALLKPLIDRHLRRQREIIGLFFAKQAGTGSSYHVHRDWALVDERRYQSLHLWLPLIDIDADNGNLFVFEGSHTKGPIVRGSPSFEYPEDKWHERITDHFGRTDLYLQKGDALFFDHRIKHGSRKNRSQDIRRVMGVSIVPDESPLIHYHRHRDGRIEIYEVSDAFYLNFNLRDTPAGQKSLGFVDEHFFHG